MPHSPPCVQASWIDPAQAAPQTHETDGSPTWTLRADRFVIALTRTQPGTVLTRARNLREYIMVLPPAADAQVRHNDTVHAIGGDSLSILPPGATEVTVGTAGFVVRIFAASETELLKSAANAHLYPDTVADAPQPWHAPLDGHRVRSYPLARYARGQGPLIRPRLFRSADLMVNAFEPFSDPRPLHELRPHAHADFDQASIALAGDWFHHMRTPWGADMAHWREDLHIQLPSPSVAVIPATVIHTSRNTSPGAWLLDVFGLPRADFLRAGIVLNAGEYAMPPEDTAQNAQHVPAAWRSAA